MINVVADTSSYNTETNHFQTLGVDILLDDGDYATMQRCSFQDRNNYNDDDVPVDRSEYTYRLRSNKIHVYPTPDFTETNGIRHHYVAVPASLNVNATTDEIDGFWGWEDYIVYDCLVKFIGGKEEGDATTWQQLLAKTDQRIDALKGRRDGASPDTVAIVDSSYRHKKRLGVSV